VTCEVGLVEDDAVIRQNLCDFLESRGFRVRSFEDRVEALAEFSKRLPDVAVLDVSLGNDREGGFTLCSQLRGLSAALPIVFLTSHDGELDQVSGLRLGADDFLSKERSFDFLVVRLETLLARRRALEDASRPSPAPAVEVGGVSLDEARSQVFWRGSLVDLPLTQYWIVRDLVRAAGRPRSHDDLMRAAEIHVEPNTIAAHIRTIRRRFQEVDPAFDAIRTERGHGYRWLVADG
jgi:two-component system OmpR family response regulator